MVDVRRDVLRPEYCKINGIRETEVPSLPQHSCTYTVKCRNAGISTGILGYGQKKNYMRNYGFQQYSI